MIKYIYFISIGLILISCTKDRKLTIDDSIVDDSDYPELKINEYLAKGSSNLNEFGEASDWVELYNTSSNAVTFTAGKWFFTDDISGDPTKFELPAKTISANGFIIIWCDESTQQGNDIHAPFKLSSSGESLGLIYKDINDSIHIVDSVSFGTQTVDGQSTGRYPDGSNTWAAFTNPTPGQTNTP